MAIKVLPPGVAEDPERLRRFVREAKAASALDHPNIAMIHEIGEAEGIHYLVMEDVKGETLEARIREHRPELAELLDIAIQTVDVLEAAHGRGIIPPDIKPANLMLTPRGQVKVLDFGLAKRFHPQVGPTATAVDTESETSPGMIMGTVEYMSPEQVLGQELDQRTDLFSLGVVLYSMVTGQLPFRGATRTDTMYRVLHAEPEAIARLKPGSPPELERIVRKCLEKDKGLRYQHASDLLADLKRLKRGVESGRAAAARTVGEATAVHGRWKWVVLDIVLLTVIGLGIVWYAKRRSEPIPEAVLSPVPLTWYPGNEYSPSFSPDGSQVAFSWNGEKQDDYDIYVKQIDVEPPSRLTTNPAEDFSPVWSPDGQSIAFLRKLSPNRRTLMIVPQRGGQERELADFESQLERGSNLAWSPDSKWLALPSVEPGKPKGLILLSVETEETRRITTVPSGPYSDITPAFSPDGHMLMFVRNGFMTSDVCLLGLGE